jgi:hypothetical protein
MIVLAFDIGIVNLAVCVSQGEKGSVPTVLHSRTYCIGRSTDPMDALIRSLIVTMDNDGDVFYPVGITRVVIEQQLGCSAPKNYALSSVVYALYARAGIDVRFASPREKFKALAVLARSEPVIAHFDFCGARGKALKKLSVDAATILADRWGAQVFIDAIANTKKKDDLADSFAMSALECIS